MQNKLLMTDVLAIYLSDRLGKLQDYFEEHIYGDEVMDKFYLVGEITLSIFQLTQKYDKSNNAKKYYDSLEMVFPKICDLEKNEIVNKVVRNDCLVWWDQIMTTITQIRELHSNKSE